MNKQSKIAGEVADMRADGISWLAISRKLGVSADTARMSVDREYAERRRQQNNARRRPDAHASPAKINRIASIRPSQADIDKALASIPVDTRGFTARACGDPLPGRSALDRLNADDGVDVTYLLGRHRP